MAGFSFDREATVYVAKLAEQVERYDDMVDAMKHVAKMGIELAADERDLLSTGYWNVIGRRRNSWGALSKLEKKEESEGNKADVRRINEYKQKVEAEITDICKELISIIDEHLIPSISTPVATVFYNKMKGDYYRYLAELKTGNEMKEAADEANSSYEAANVAAVLALPRADPLRLGLDLNISVFYNLILDSPQRACDIAKQAVDEATPELDNLQSEKAYKRSIHILGLLEENIKLWNSDSLSWSDAVEDFTDF